MRQNRRNEGENGEQGCAQPHDALKTQEEHASRLNDDDGSRNEYRCRQSERLDFADCVCEMQSLIRCAE
jgi:hypothetical protein